MPITTLMLMYATSQVSNYVYASYFSAGLVVGLSATLGGVYLSQQDSSKIKDSEMRGALNDLISLVENPLTEAKDFDQKLASYQQLFDSQTLEFFRKDFQLRHEQKSFNPSENSAFIAPRKKVVWQNSTC